MKWRAGRGERGADRRHRHDAGRETRYLLGLPFEAPDYDVAVKLQQLGLEPGAPLAAIREASERRLEQHYDRATLLRRKLAGGR